MCQPETTVTVLVAFFNYPTFLPDSGSYNTCYLMPDSCGTLDWPHSICSLSSRNDSSLEFLGHSPSLKELHLRRCLTIDHILTSRLSYSPHLMSKLSVGIMEQLERRFPIPTSEYNQSRSPLLWRGLSKTLTSLINVHGSRILRVFANTDRDHNRP